MIVAPPSKLYAARLSNACGQTSFSLPHFPNSWDSWALAPGAHGHSGLRYFSLQAPRATLAVGSQARTLFYPHPPNTASRVSYDRRKSRLTSLRITNVDLHHIIAPDDMTARQCAARLGLSAVGPGLRHPFASPQAQRSHSTPIIATSNSCSCWSRNRPCSNRRPSHVMASAVLHRKLRSISGLQPQTAESFHDRQEQHQETGPASSQAG